MYIFKDCNNNVQHVQEELAEFIFPEIGVGQKVGYSRVSEANLYGWQSTNCGKKYRYVDDASTPSNEVAHAIVAMAKLGLSFPVEGWYFYSANGCVRMLTPNQLEDRKKRGRVSPQNDRYACPGHAYASLIYPIEGQIIEDVLKCTSYQEVEDLFFSFFMENGEKDISLGVFPKWGAQEGLYQLEVAII